MVELVETPAAACNLGGSARFLAIGVEEEGVDGDGAVGTADQRVDVEGGDLVAQLDGQLADPHHRLHDGVHVRCGSAAHAVQHRREPLQPGNQVAGRGGRDRWQGDRALRHHLDQRATRRDHHDRPDQRVVHEAERDLDAGRHLLLDQHARAEPIGQVVVRRCRPHPGRPGRGGRPSASVLCEISGAAVLSTTGSPSSSAAAVAASRLAAHRVETVAMP